LTSRFTDRARHVLTVARDGAARTGHPEVRTEHLLLGLLDEDQATAAVLTRLGVSRARSEELVKQELAKIRQTFP
jgi:ATP-dependent Clp protease ATP-binding subunit ClpC